MLNQENVPNAASQVARPVSPAEVGTAGEQGAVPAPCTWWAPWT